MKTRILFLKRFLLLVILIVAFALSACASVIATPTTIPTATSTATSFFPPSGHLEISVDGHSGILEWEGPENSACMVTIQPVEGGARDFNISSEPCTRERVVRMLEGFKERLSPDAPAWASEWLDQAISEVKQLK